MKIHIHAPDSLNHVTARLVKDFAEALAGKLAYAEEKYGYTTDWLTRDWEVQCRQHLLDHVQKGDPLDVAAYCAFMWHRQWSTASPPEQPLRGRESVREIAHRHCTCTCRGDPAVLQNHTNLCDEISDAILEYAILSALGIDGYAAPEQPAALRGRESIMEECARAVLSMRYGPPSSWLPGNPKGWHLERDCTPTDASMHDNGCNDAFKAIHALSSAAPEQPAALNRQRSAKKGGCQ